ncbi:two-component regulator propeller domain-containing protein [Chitinophaga lutea]
METLYRFDKKHLHLIIVLLALIVRWETSFSQAADVRHFTSEDGLPQNSIKGIYIDVKGYIWMGTEAGLVRFDGVQFKLVNQVMDGSILGERIVSLHTSNGGKKIYFRATDKKFYQVVPSLRLQAFEPTQEERRQAEVNKLSIPYRLTTETRHLADSGKFGEWIVPDLQWLRRSAPRRVEQHRDRYYYFNQAKELISADSALHDFQRVKISGLLPPAVADPSSEIAFSVLRFQDDLYIRWGAWIYRLAVRDDGRLARATPILHVGGLPNINAFAMYPDTNLFVVGTLTDGFYLIRPSSFSVLLFKDPEANIFYAQAPLGRKVLTAAGTLSSPPGVAGGGYLPFAMLRTRDGRYVLNRYASGTDAGVEIKDSLMHVLHFLRSPHLKVNSMLETDDGTIWIAADSQFLGRVTNDSLQWLPPPPSHVDYTSIAVMERASAKEIWLANGRELAKYNPATGAVLLYPGLRNIRIRALRQDEKGVLWIGTYGNGYYALRNGRIIKMPLDRHNFMVNVHAFVPDDAGYYWMTTNQGLFQAKLSDLYDYIEGRTSSVYYHFYGKDDGLLTNEFNGGCSPSGIRLDDGRISFPSMKGIVQFDPNAVHPALSGNGIFIDGVMADTLPLNYAAAGLTVPSGTEALQITVSSPYFGTPHNHAIYYRVQGMKTGWQPVPRNGVITLGRLETGRYTLDLEKAAGFGGKKIATRLSFTVAPAFYETWWFRIAAALAVVGLLWFAFRLRLTLLVKQKETLQTQIVDATKEQRRLIEHLESTVEELEQSQQALYNHTILQEKLARIITHDLQSPLRFLTDIAERIKREIHRSQFTPLDELSTELQRSAAGIYRFVQDFGLWLSSIGTNFQPTKERVSFGELAATLQTFFPEVLRTRGNTLEITADENIVLHADGQMLLIMLRNIIDNANKHCTNGHIHVIATMADDFATITITDSGKGFSPDALQKVTALLHEPERAIADRGSSGYGFRFIADFARVLHIGVRIESRPGVGTTVRLDNIPVYVEKSADRRALESAKNCI